MIVVTKWGLDRRMLTRESEVERRFHW